MGPKVSSRPILPRSQRTSALFSVCLVVKPPDVVRLATLCDDAAQWYWVVDASPAISAADVPDLNSVVPERGDEDAVSHEDIMDVRVAHRRRENLLRGRGVGDVDDHEPRRCVTDRIDAEERVELT